MNGRRHVPDPDWKNGPPDPPEEIEGDEEDFIEPDDWVDPDEYVEALSRWERDMEKRWR